MNDLKGLRRSKGFIPLLIAVVLFVGAGLLFAVNSGNAASTSHAAVKAAHSVTTPTKRSATPSPVTPTTVPGVSTPAGKTGGATGTGGGSGSRSGGSGPSGGGTYTPPPVISPPVTSPPPPPPAGPCGGISCIIQGDNGVAAALNVARASRGLPPVSGYTSTSLTQNCALNGNGGPCTNNEAATGVTGTWADGGQAVNNWMSVSSSLLLMPGVSAGGAYNFHVDVGWAWVAGAGHGFVVVISVCSNTPNAVVYC